jgi:hypothetical protein
MLEIKLQYADRHNRILPLSIDVPYLRQPPFLAAWILTEDFLSYIEDSVTFMYRNMETPKWVPLAAKGFFDYEIHRMERLYYVVRDNMGNVDNNILQRKNFASFVDEYDSRRETNFLQTFPEMEAFYYHCKEL